MAEFRWPYTQSVKTISKITRSIERIHILRPENDIVADVLQTKMSVPSEIQKFPSLKDEV